MDAALRVEVTVSGKREVLTEDQRRVRCTGSSSMGAGFASSLGTGWVSFGSEDSEDVD